MLQDPVATQMPTKARYVLVWEGGEACFLYSHGSSRSKSAQGQREMGSIENLNKGHLAPSRVFVSCSNRQRTFEEVTQSSTCHTS